MTSTPSQLILTSLRAAIAAVQDRKVFSLSKQSAIFHTRMALLRLTGTQEDQIGASEDLTEPDEPEDVPTLGDLLYGNVT